MNIRIIVFTAFLVVSSCVSVLGQQPRVDPPPGEVLFRKFDEIHTLSGLDLKARLDNIAINFERAPADGVLYLIAYAGPRACAGDADRLGLRAKTYLVAKRGVSSQRVILMDGGFLDRPVLDVWMLPSHVSPPSAEPNIDRKLVRVRNCRKRSPVRRGRA